MPAQFAEWIAALERRHLADLRFPEVARALRSLSSAYVERRRTAIPGRRVLDGAGKRAAFALYYGPLHFLAVERCLTTLCAEKTDDGRALPVVDLGCGTGAAGAAAAVSTGARSITGVDSHPWAIDEARLTYAAFGLPATLMRTSVGKFRVPHRPAFLVASYLINELAADDRARLLEAVFEARRAGSRVLIVEPLARAAAPWWPEWVAAFEASGIGFRADEWKLRVDPPPIVARLGQAAGLTATSVNVRTIYGA